ncbi:hypothetical protein [Streptomyces aureocirculatus]|uniref:hypothetical protein n=1 Tax=Streptomyces aureocirculatus TaxID=67275 RepID=UPI0004CB6044|nr:hypothetical protein [Streptomyces aureocirculatus]
MGRRYPEIWGIDSTASLVFARHHVYGSTGRSERVKLGDAFFRNGPLGLSAKSTGGVDTGFNREPGGTLNRVRAFDVAKAQSAS